MRPTPKKPNEAMPGGRSALMARVRQKNTSPELVVRKRLFGLGFRFSLHRKDLPGTPDVVLPRYESVIFVHGCFWHRHRKCPHTTTPKTRTDFWTSKFEANVARDRRNLRELRRLGWRTLIVWSCETNDPDVLDAKLLGFLRSPVTADRLSFPIL